MTFNNWIVISRCSQLLSLPADILLAQPAYPSSSFSNHTGFRSSTTKRTLPSAMWKRVLCIAQIRSNSMEGFMKEKKEINSPIETFHPTCNTHKNPISMEDDRVHFSVSLVLFYTLPLPLELEPMAGSFPFPPQYFTFRLGPREFPWLYFIFLLPSADGLFFFTTCHAPHILHHRLKSPP